MDNVMQDIPAVNTSDFGLFVWTLCCASPSRNEICAMHVLEERERALRNVGGKYLLSLVSFATKYAVGDYINQTKISAIV
jgi:hypothetical protein